MDQEREFHEFSQSKLSVDAGMSKEEAWALHSELSKMGEEKAESECGTSRVNDVGVELSMLKVKAKAKKF